MADGFTEFPIFLISFVAGAAIIFWIFISKLVKRVLISKVSSTDAQEQSKISESLTNASKKSHQSHLNKSNNKKKLWDKRNRDGKQSFKHQWLLTSLKGHTSEILDMEFSPNGKFLATCGEDRAVFLWSTKDWHSNLHKNARLNIEYDHASLVRWSPDSKALIVRKTAENVAEVYKWSKRNDGWIGGFTKAFTYPKLHNNEIIGLGISPTGKYMMSCSNKTDLIICDIKGTVLTQVDTNLDNTYCAAISPCGKYITASGSLPSVKIWEVQLDEVCEAVLAFELKGHSSGIHQVAFSSDTSRMGTVSDDGTWKVFNFRVDLKKEDPWVIATGKYDQESENPQLALSPSGDVVAIACGSSLSLYFADTGEPDATIHDIFNGPISRVLFDDEGKYVLVSGERHVRVFHNVTGYKAVINSAKTKLKNPNNNTATKERLQQQIADAEKFISSINKQ